MGGRSSLSAVSTALAVVAIVAIGAGCNGEVAEDVPESARVRVASFDFAESRLIAELYAQAIESRGLTVERLGAIGPREIVAPALQQGHVDVVPEYLGTALRHFGSVPGAERATAVDERTRLAETLEPRGLDVFEPAPAEDVNVFVVTEEIATRFGLVRISDLADVAQSLVLGGPVECPDRPLCLQGLRSTYGLTFEEFTPHRSLALTAEALVRTEVDVGVMFSTAAELTSGPFVVLEDDRALQPAENVVPLVRRAAGARWGAPLTEALDGVSRNLTTEALQAMNRRAHDGEPDASIAGTWLRSVGLVASP